MQVILLKSELREKSDRSIMVWKCITYPLRDFPRLPASSTHNNRLSWGSFSVLHMETQQLTKVVTSQSRSARTRQGQGSASPLHGSQFLSLPPGTLPQGAGSSHYKRHLSRGPWNSVLSFQGVKNVVNVQNFDLCAASQS